MTPSEMVTIAVVALIVFGPQRLVDLSRKAGRIAGELRRTSDELRSTLQKEVEQVAGPLREAKTEIAAAGKEIKETADGQLKWVDTPAGAEGSASGSEVGEEDDTPGADDH
ncbi:MAG: twin-arginine translocase TatA/TatE family subunit [Acidimicrobiia bacterium]